MSAAAEAPAPGTATAGDFTWHELMTDDPAGAQAFYAQVFGWRFDQGAVGGRSYSVILAGDTAIGGMLGLDQAMLAGGARPVWAGYVAVDGLGAASENLHRRGGQILMDDLAIPGMGRCALAADPEGVPIYLMEYDAPPPASGTFVWNELAARDQDGTQGFYCGLFGWRQEGEMPMGELGDYRFLNRGERMIGAIMPVGNSGKANGWTFYFAVPDIDAAASRVRESGGTLLQGPDEIPGGDFSASARDPSGAIFGMVGPRRA
ncbi:VOC family protein [Erythrobacter oryzae]|uniref:VOC family protein n=1 Tax=Erythrobacter oryzae TaxID=3019556 RepID=UPI00255393E7|nr:VOC family protein [Erythrobacter sp. COR-2]